MTKQVRQAITPTHVLGSTGTDTADDLGYRALADLKSDMGLNLADLADTWNDAGTTFTAIKMNVTDTASASGSLLMDLQVGGVTHFSVREDGNIEQNSSIITDVLGLVRNNAYSGKTENVVGFNENGFWIVISGSYVFKISGLTERMVYKGGFSISDNPAANDGDIDVLRDAAGTLAQRRTTNPQTFRLYNTYTDASNYERGFMKWNSNVLEIGTEAGGTGTARDVVLNGSNRVAKISDVSTGTDTAYETAINAIIDALEAHGLAASV